MKLILCFSLFVLGTSAKAIPENAWIYGRAPIGEVLPLEQILEQLAQKLNKPTSENQLVNGKNYDFVLYRAEGKAAEIYQFFGKLTYN